MSKGSSGQHEQLCERDMKRLEDPGMSKGSSGQHEQLCDRDMKGSEDPGMSKRSSNPGSPPRLKGQGWTV